MTHTRSNTCSYTSSTGFIVAVALLAICPSESYAIGGTLCNLINGVVFGVGTLSGTGIAQPIATIGVLMVGVGAALGRVSWTLALTVAVGIAAVFAANSIAADLGGGC